MINTKWNGKCRSIVGCISVILAVNLVEATLSDSYEMSEGEMVAIQLNIYGQTKWKTSIEQNDAPFLAHYNKEDDYIVVQIYGATDKIQPARDMIDLLRRLLDKDFIPWVKNVHDVDMIPNDVKFIYRNRTEEGMRQILYWQNGKFIFPVNE